MLTWQRKLNISICRAISWVQVSVANTHKISYDYHYPWKLLRWCSNKHRSLTPPHNILGAAPLPCLLAEAVRPSIRRYKARYNRTTQHNSWCSCTPKVQTTSQELVCSTREESYILVGRRKHSDQGNDDEKHLLSMIELTIALVDGSPSAQYQRQWQ
jgi:hypothetical protein